MAGFILASSASAVSLVAISIMDFAITISTITFITNFTMAVSGEVASMAPVSVAAVFTAAGAMVADVEPKETLVRWFRESARF
jgi:hypothetical protein